MLITPDRAFPTVMIRVAVNGYGTIGKRVADAVAAQPDMEIVGVSKTRPSAEAYAAASRGFPLYIADMNKEPAFADAGLDVAGSVEEMLAEADLVVDATPGGGAGVPHPGGPPRPPALHDPVLRGRILHRLEQPRCPPALCPGRGSAPLPPHPGRRRPPRPGPRRGAPGACRGGAPPGHSWRSASIGLRFAAFHAG